MDSTATGLEASKLMPPRMATRPNVDSMASQLNAESTDVVHGEQVQHVTGNEASQNMAVLTPMFTANPMDSQAMAAMVLVTQEANA